MEQLEDKTKVEKQEDDLNKRFQTLHDKFVINNINKIQRYLVNTLGLKPIDGKTPLNSSKPRQFVTLTEYQGKLQYCIKISYGSIRIATVPTGCMEFEKKGIVSALKQTYYSLQEDSFISDFWNYFAENPEMARKHILTDEPTVTEIKAFRNLMIARKAA